MDMNYQWVPFTVPFDSILSPSILQHACNIITTCRHCDPQRMRITCAPTPAAFPITKHLTMHAKAHLASPDYPKQFSFHPSADVRSSRILPALLSTSRKRIAVLLIPSCSSTDILACCLRKEGFGLCSVSNRIEIPLFSAQLRYIQTR